MVSLEKLTEGELKIIAAEYELLASEARKKISLGRNDIDVPEISLPDPAKAILHAIIEEKKMICLRGYNYVPRGNRKLICALEL